MRISKNEFQLKLDLFYLENSTTFAEFVYLWSLSFPSIFYNENLKNNRLSFKDSKNLLKT
jgi:hypothetical protein